jgi:hypothetical protein
VVVGLVGLATLKLDWKRTLSREEALLNGPGIGGTGGMAAVEVEAEAVLDTRGMGREPPGLTVACILASEEAVGAYNLEEGTVLVFLAFEDEVDCDSSEVGGAGAGRTFFRISA